MCEVRMGLPFPLLEIVQRRGEGLLRSGEEEWRD